MFEECDCICEEIYREIIFEEIYDRNYPIIMNDEELNTERD